MTNYEYLTSHDCEDISHFLCAAMEQISGEEYYPCELCPMNEKCHADNYGGNGWFNWLMEEVR